MADGTEEGEGGRVLKLIDGLVCVTCDVGPGQCGVSLLAADLFFLFNLSC
jgi:hypothetical protein